MNKHFYARENPRLITTKSVFIISIIVTCLTVLSVWLLGLGTHRSIFINSILSTSIISIAFFLFITIGLFRGLKLKDNIGEITDKIKSKSYLNQSEGNSDLDSSNLALDTPAIIPDFDDDDGSGILFAILAWVFYSIIFVFVFWLLGAVLWTGILFFAAMLYWVFFRALRLIFKKSNHCKGNLILSFLYAIGYTTLYNFWIYGIIMAAHYLS